MTANELFDVGPRTPLNGPGSIPPPSKTCTPDVIGSGPAGETCKTCKFKVYNEWAKKYIKCALMKHAWTKGSGTDIKAGWAACSKWEAKTNE